MTEPIPDWYDDLEGFERAAWRSMARGVKDRRSGFHTLTVASVTTSGLPNARTVVLRGCDPDARTLRFHTDARSAKVGELRANANVCALLYDRQSKLQVRVTGRCTLSDAQSAQGSKAWSATRSFSRECYRVSPTPGSRIEAGGAYGPADASDGHEAFIAAEIVVGSVEVLYLAAAGHRRALFTPGRREWLVP